MECDVFPLTTLGSKKLNVNIPDPVSKAIADQINPTELQMITDPEGFLSPQELGATVDNIEE